MIIVAFLLSSKGIFEQVKDWEKNTIYSCGWQADEESHTKGRWEEGQRLQRGRFKRRECIIQLYVCTEKPRRLPTRCMWGVERDADQSRSRKMVGRKVKERKSLMAERVMCRDAVCQPGLYGANMEEKDIFQDH